MLLLALFEQSLLLHALTWNILWLEEEWGKLALLLALFEQRLLLQSLTWVILWVVLGKKPMAIAAGARLVPRNTPIAIAPIAITAIAAILKATPVFEFINICYDYLIINMRTNSISGYHLWYSSSTLYKSASAR